VEHCQHCCPRIEWVENSPGKPPQFMFKGFPSSGQVVLANQRCVVFCSRCIEGMLRGLLAQSRKDT
jgi:hypothetical protein